MYCMHVLNANAISSPLIRPQFDRQLNTIVVIGRNRVEHSIIWFLYHIIIFQLYSQEGTWFTNIISLSTCILPHTHTHTHTHPVSLLLLISFVFFLFYLIKLCLTFLYHICLYPHNFIAEYIISSIGHISYNIALYSLIIMWFLYFSKRTSSAHLIFSKRIHAYARRWRVSLRFLRRVPYSCLCWNVYERVFKVRMPFREDGYVCEEVVTE